MLNPEFIEDTKHKAIHTWRWKNPFIAGILAFLHPLGMLYTSLIATIIYIIVWTIYVYFFPIRPRPWFISLIISLIFAYYAYWETRWKNGAIEMWRYGLPGNGLTDPKKLGLELKGPDKKRYLWIF